MKQLVAELQHEQVDVRRAWENGPPMIVPDAPGEPVPYDRPSGAADILADKGHLTDVWSPSKMVDGIVADRTLLDQWVDARARQAKTPEIRKLLNAMKRAGGAWDKADRGTIFHEWAQKVTSARCTIDEVPEEFRRAVAAYIVALADCGLTIVAVERLVVWDERRLAGTFDALVRNADGEHFILDIKTGSLQHLGLLVQLYVYASAPYYFAQGEALDGTDDVREAKPATSTTLAYVAEVDIDAGTCKIREVDLTAGAEALDLADAVRDLRTVKSWGRALNGARAQKEAVDATFGETVEVSHVDEAWRTEMRERIAAIIAAGHTDDILRAWPTDVPTLKSGEPITLSQGEALAEAIATVEREHELPFYVGTPSEKAAPVRTAPKRRPKADEGDEVDDNAVGLLNARAQLLSPTARDWVAAIMASAGKKARPIRMTGKGGAKTARRLAIGTALIAVAELDDDDLVRVLLGHAIGTDVQPSVDLGDAFGSLTIAEAERLTRIAQAIDDLRLTVTYDASGPSIAGDLAAVAA